MYKGMVRTGGPKVTPLLAEPTDLGADWRADTGSSLLVPLIGVCAFASTALLAV